MEKGDVYRDSFSGTTITITSVDEEYVRYRTTTVIGNVSSGRKSLRSAELWIESGYWVSEQEYLPLLYRKFMSQEEIDRENALFNLLYHAFKFSAESGSTDPNRLTTSDA